MKPCKRCGSFAINHHRHGRDGSDEDLCDVCYWRKRAEEDSAALQNLLNSLFKKHAPKPRELPQQGTGALFDEQQYCFNKGWKEGIAALRKSVKSTNSQQD